MYVAIGSRHHDSNRGQVRIFRYVTNFLGSKVWSQESTIDGEDDITRRKYR